MMIHLIEKFHLSCTALGNIVHFKRIKSNVMIIDTVEKKFYTWVYFPG